MSDFDDRLAALDPAAGRTYQHPDLEGLITRITTAPLAPRRSVWRNFELKVAWTLIAGSVVAAGAVAIFQSAPSLATLALRSTASSHSFAAVNVPATSPMQLYERLDFTAGPGLSPTPTTPSYALTIPADPASEAARVAAVFGLTGTPTNSNGDWTVTGASGAALDYQTAGLPQWYYSSSTPAIAPATQSATATGPVPSPSTITADAQRYLTLLGYTYQLGSPTFSSSTQSTTAANGTTQVTQSLESVSFSVMVNGVATDQTVSFSVDSHNDVAYASGPALSVGPPVDYPLQSPESGVAALNAAQASKSPASSSTTPAPRLVDVTLTADSVSLATYQLTNGAYWFLPVYTYSGVITQVTGPSSGTWRELAIQPSYVKAGAPSPGAITSGGVSY